MKKKVFLLCAVTVFAFVLTAFFSTEVQAASGSCQSRSEGKLDCMEFTGNLPAALKQVCTIAGSAKWVDSACPQDNVLAFCEVPRKDTIRQRGYCYRMAQIPDAQRIEHCRMGCNGTFSTTQGPAAGAVAPAPPSAKPTVSAGAGVAVTPRPVANTGAAQYKMEQNMNRFGEDYKDLGLDTPNPALCAQACMSEAKCKAWTYVKPGVQADNAWCWLKDKVPPPTPDENCVSGVKK